MMTQASQMSDPVHSDPLREVVYTPESKIRHPRRLLSEMWHDLHASRELAWRLMVRDISAQYRRSLLGLFWAFLPPIVTAAIFIILHRQEMFNVRETDLPYPAFVLVGTVLWQVFVDSVNAPLKSVTAARSMLAKIKFPYEALVLSAIGQVLFNLGMKVVILIVVFIAFKIPITWSLALSPFAILMLILLGIFIGLLLTPIGVLYTDISTGLVMVTNLWFYTTPVVYPPPQSFPFSLLTTLNPVSPLLTGTRDLITNGNLENAGAFAVVSVLTFTGLAFAWVLYRLALPILIERMSA